MSGKRPVVASIVVLASVAGGCAVGTDSVDVVGQAGSAGCDVVAAVENAPVRVAASVAPITNIVSVIAAGGRVDVVGLVPEGFDSHTFAPAPSVAATLEGADIVFLNGLGLETPIRELAIANADGALCELGDATMDPDEYIFDYSFPEEAGLPNPHLWTNPPMVRSYAAVVRDVLSAVDPDDADRYRDNFERFTDQIDRLNEAIIESTESIPADDRLLLTYHDAYAYFARDYGWTIVGAVQPRSFNEPTPQEVAALSEQIADRGVPAIFGSEVFPSPVLQQLASETGATYVDDLRDDDLPGAQGDAEHSWLALMRQNLIVIVEAFGGDAEPLRALDLTAFATDEARYP